MLLGGLGEKEEKKNTVRTRDTSSSDRIEKISHIYNCMVTAGTTSKDGNTTTGQKQNQIGKSSMAVGPITEQKQTGWKPVVSLK
jgi:hypothetical protein